MQTSYDNTNIKVASNIYNLRSSSNYVHGVSNRHSSDYTAIGTHDQSSNYDRDNYNRKLEGDIGRYMYDTTSPNLDCHISFPYRNPKTRVNDSSKRNSYPKPFRASASTGALLNHYDGGNQLSPSKESSRKRIHKHGGCQNHTQSISGYKSMPSISINVVERRSRGQALVVGKQICYVRFFTTILITTLY